MLKILSFFLPLNKKDTWLNKTYPTFVNALPEKKDLSALAKAYKEVFSEKPWNEQWSQKDVIEKVKKDLMKSDKIKSFLTLIRTGNNEFPISGFCWGAIIRGEQVLTRVVSALEIKGESRIKIDRFLRQTFKKEEKLIFFDEFAIVKQFRAGVDPVRYLLKESLKEGYCSGTKKAMFWTTPKSKIYFLALYMGFIPLFPIMLRGKKIVFLLNPDFIPLLRITENISAKGIRRILKIVSFSK